MNSMRRIKLFLATFTVLMVGLSGALPTLVSAAQPSTDKTTTSGTDSAQQSVCQALEAGSDCKTTPHGSVSVNNIITTIVNIFSFVVGTTAVIMVIVGGFRYVTSGGDSSKVASAKGTITYALVGIVIVALAQGIVRFVLKSV